MGVDCSSCGCKDQNEFKLNEVQLDDKSSRKNQVYGTAYDKNVSVLHLIRNSFEELLCAGLEQCSIWRADHGWYAKWTAARLGVVQAPLASDHPLAVSLARSHCTHVSLDVAAVEACRQSLLHCHRVEGDYLQHALQPERKA